MVRVILKVRLQKADYDEVTALRTKLATFLAGETDPKLLEFVTEEETQNEEV